MGSVHAQFPFTSAQLDALDLLSTPLWLFDLDSLRMEWANKAALELWDADSLATLRARNFGDVTESTRIRLESYREGIAQGRSYHERWTFYPKGRPVVVDCRCGGTGLPGAEALMLVEAKPVVSGEADRDALRMVEALRHTSVMISLYRPDGTAVLRNPAGIRVFGLPDPDADVPGNTIWSHFVDQSEAERLKQVLAAGGVYSAEVEQNTLLGRCWFDFNARMTTDPVSGNQLILINGTDISRRRNAEELRAKAVIEAENAAQSRSRFLANVSHELRTPMNGVIGMTNLLLGTALSEEQHHFVDIIRSSGESLLTLINDILEFSKIDAGRLELVESPYDFVATACAVINIAGGMLSGKPVTICSELSPELPQLMLGDGNRMKQILLNLLSNAAKFTMTGTVTLRAMVVGEGARRLRVEVQDSGIGIASADQARLFRSFSQIDNKDTRAFRGTGLGLAICRELLLMMKGSIGVDSELGKGSLFWFEVPLRIAAPENNTTTPATSAPMQTVVGDARHSLSVLLVEDNPINQRVATLMLGKLGHDVSVAADGNSAISMAAARRFDIIFMDVQLPDIDGYTATAAIRQSGGSSTNVPIIALTANAMAGDERQCLAAGMDGYLSKPVTMAQFAAELARIKSDPG